MKIILLLTLILLSSCDINSNWNNPYPSSLSGKNIYFASFSERPKHLDPARAYSSNEYAFIAQIYEPPLQYHYLKRPYTLVPLSATSVPKPQFFDKNGKQLSDDVAVDKIDHTVYEIRIKSGIKYQPHPCFVSEYHALSESQLSDIDQLSDFKKSATRELTAHDFVYQIKRLAHSKIQSPIYGLMSEYIIGLKDLRNNLINSEIQSQALTKHNLSGVEIVDKYTYRIKIKGKYPQFIYWLAMPFFSPMPWEADKFFSQTALKKRNISLDWYPVGTGPYMLTINNPNSKMVLEKNPNFHGEFYPSEGSEKDKALLKDAGKALPFIDKAIYSLEKEMIPYWNKFLQAYYDTSSISSDNFDHVVSMGISGSATLTDDMKAKGIKLITSIQTSTYYLGFNMLDSTLGGYSESARKLRQAISIAIDIEEYISIFENGRGIAAQGPLPKGIFGYRKNQIGMNPYVYDWINGRLKRKSIKLARRLLAEAGYSNGIDAKTGKPLVLYLDWVSGGADDKSLLNWYRKQIAKLDIQLIIRATDYNRFQDKMRNGNAQIFPWGWNADYPDPENFLFLLYGSNGKAKYGGENAANYQNKNFDALFEQMKNMDNNEARQKIIDDMIEILRYDAPWIWGHHPRSFTLQHEWIKNVKPNLMANNTLKYKRIDPEKREQYRQLANQPIVWPIFILLIFLIIMLTPAIISYQRRERMVLVYEKN
jgi:oligopeptide transport system substrate-binding protein